VLIAEDLVRMALNPDGTLARGASYQPMVSLGVTAALVSELTLDGHVDVTDGRIHLNGSRPDHPVLARTYENLAPHEGKKLRSRLSSIKHSGWPEVVDHMVETGVLGREKPAAVRTTRHPVTDPAAHAALLAEVRAAATSDGPLEAHTAVLLALSGPCHLLEVVAPERADRKHARRRIDEAADLVPAADAVKVAIEEIVVATTVAATTAATFG
jgi:Golgi phosphoprotein 3 (GPP34)